MNVRGGAEEVLLVFWLAVVDNKRDCPDVDASAYGLRAQQNLYLPIFQFGDSCSLGGGAILRMDVILSHFANSSALSMYIIHIDIILSRIRGPLVVDHKFISLILQRKVKLSEFWDSVEEDDNLRF